MRNGSPQPAAPVSCDRYLMDHELETAVVRVIIQLWILAGVGYGLISGLVLRPAEPDTVEPRLATDNRLLTNCRRCAVRVGALRTFCPACGCLRPSANSCEIVPASFAGPAHGSQ